ncbi:PREDICTED: uncharacterized protein LOC105361712 [Ceratosolen solmsi marchali]|uniref:Uncharacterized protein LOC105361712 n=1 Tax=Ceratosolen solmsi marchali TaxID=326594 RepID=A0AAJ6YFS4_9HYME|nr:PREDICTED: uncharacterized protein LOC105361712 [Ceratosolen solmsi marchali]
MLLPRLRFVVSSACKINRKTFLLFQKGFKNTSTIGQADLNDKPISYSKSQAAAWKALYNRETPNDTVWYSPLIVSASLTIFLIYFCLLREENDIDEIIYRPLSKTIKDIDKKFPEYSYSQLDHINSNEKHLKSEKENN